MDKLIKGDLHFHTTYGAEPEEIIQAAEKRGLDVLAATEYNHFNGSYYELTRAAERAFEENNKLIQLLGIRKSIQILLGVEITTNHDREKFHFAYIFRDRYKKNEMPELPPKGESVDELMKFMEEYSRYYPGALIFNHPTTKSSNDDLIEGIIDDHEIIKGMEIINFEFIRKAFSYISTISRAIDILNNLQEKGRKIAILGSSDARLSSTIGLASTGFLGNKADDLFEKIDNAETFAMIPSLGKIKGDNPENLRKILNKTNRYF